MRLLPSAMARPLAYRHARKIAARYLNGNVRRVGSFLLLDVPRSITLGTAPGAIGCTYYEASLRELLLLLDRKHRRRRACSLQWTRRRHVRVARRLALVRSNRGTQLIRIRDEYAQC